MPLQYQFAIELYVDRLLYFFIYTLPLRLVITLLWVHNLRFMWNCLVQGWFMDTIRVLASVDLPLTVVVADFSN